SQQRDLLPSTYQRVAVGTQNREIGAGAECASRTGDDDRADAGVGRDGAEGGDQLVTQRRSEGVELLGTIQRDRRDAVGDLREDETHTRSTIIAMPWPTPMHIVTNP